jgi:Uma2 family endonuclease
MSILSRPLTYSDLERIRETSDEFFELIEGELFVTPAPTPLHQFVSQRLYDLLKLTVVTPGLGLISYAPLDVFFAEHTILQPELIVLLGERVNQIGEKYVEGPPSLVIEIASPSTSSRDQGMKLNLYAQYGVPEYWFVDVENRSVTVFSKLRNGRYEHELTTREVAVSETIPGLSADLKSLFAPILGV